MKLSGFRDQQTLLNVTFVRLHEISSICHTTTICDLHRKILLEFEEFARTNFIKIIDKSHLRIKNGRTHVERNWFYKHFHV